MHVLSLIDDLFLFINNQNGHIYFSCGIYSKYQYIIIYIDKNIVIKYIFSILRKDSKNLVFSQN
jgi:hypothetical protein